MNRYFPTTSITIIMLLLGLLSQCKDNPNNQLESWLKSSHPANEVKMDELSRLTFSSNYRSSEWKSENKELYIEYGGRSALTFSDPKNYQSMMLLDLARNSYRTYFYGKKRGLETLRISLVKPLYIKNESREEVNLQEFEVYRIQIQPKHWEIALEKTGDKTLPDPYETNINDHPEGKLLKFLQNLPSIWKIELNEFSRIAVE
jgi:hypothetical protein